MSRSSPNSVGGIRYRVSEFWEPLAPAAGRDSPSGLKTAEEVTEERFVLCEGYHRLRQQIQDYAEGRVSGHSFLLAGHRGAGKTLLAHLAIQMARWRIESPQANDPQTSAAIPFLVPLHGPDLLRDPGPEDKWKPKSAHLPLPIPPDEERMAANAMKQVAFALHRAFAEEILQRFASRVGNPDLSAQLKVELNGHPDLSNLVGIWNRAGILKNGVLELERPKRVIGSKGPSKASQGRRELVALHTLLQVVKFLSLSSDAEIKMPEVAGVKVQLQTPALKSLVRLLRPTISVAVGVIAALIMAKENQSNWYLPGAIFVITTILTNRFLHVFGGTMHDPAIVEQNTLASLDRSVPLLVNRVFDAGFAPVFVIDELDKVDDLDECLKSFMRQLKYFVTDRAMFCFLCDRNYFERLNLGIGKHPDPYPEETTYFGDRLLIHYRPQDIDSYLDNAFKKPEGDEEVGQFALFLYVAKYQSRVHPDRLRRYLRGHYERESDQNGDTLFVHKVVTGGYWTNPGIRMNILVQVAIEHVYYSHEVQQRIQLENEFSAWVLDALYYVVSCWEKQKAVNLSGDGFRRHLLSQIHQGTDKNSELDEVRVKFLLKQAERVVSYLRFPRRLYLDLSESRNTPNPQSMHARYGFQPGLDMILMLVALSRPLLKLEDGGAPIAAQHLEWEFDPFGSALQTLGPSDEGLTLKFDPLKSAILKPGRAKFDDYLDALAQKDTRKLLEYRVPRAFNFEKALLEIWANEGYIVFCQACRGELPKRELPKFLAQKGETAAQVMEETDHAIWLVNRIMEPKLRPALGGFMIRLVDRKLKNRDETLVISIKQALASQDIESLATAENRILDQIASPEKKKLAETHMWWLREDDFPTDKWSEHWLELWKLAR